MFHVEDTIEQRVVRNTPRLLLYFGAGGIAITIGLRIARSAELTWFTAIARSLLAGLQVFTWAWVVLLFVLFGCAVVSIVLRRLFGNPSRTTMHRILALIVGAALVGFFLLVPMCFGSLSEGTYECITLARRALNLVNGA